MSGKFIELNRLEPHSPQCRLYYQYKGDRLPCTTLTIHALLHVADTIEVLGLVWVWWSFLSCTWHFSPSFIPSFYLFKTHSRHQTRDKRGPLLIESIQSDTKATTGLLGIVIIPVQHVVVIRTHGPICHRYPLDKMIRLENHVFHLQLGAVTTNLFLQVKKEGRDYWVGGSRLCRLWHSNVHRDDRQI